ncbi:MAG: 30S ribosomal protein S16 [Candidatus Omnitrophica bacterium]|nr:30S ribosomal protein S16 [Candidatus Omnitrophota bacterium]
MAARIRLRRVGKGAKGKPHYRISVMHRHAGRDSRVKEELGFYTPGSKQYRINMERLEYWVKNGAQMSETVAGLAKKSKKAGK